MPTVEEYQQQLASYGALRHLLGSLRVVAAIRWQQVRRELAEAEAYAAGIRTALSPLTDGVLDLAAAGSGAGQPGIVLISSDEGLVGGFNHPVFNRCRALCDAAGGEALIVVLGERGRQFVHQAGWPVLYERGHLFRDAGDQGDLFDVCEALVTALEQGRLRDVTVVYNHFHGFSRYEPVTRRIFPPAIPEAPAEDRPLLGSAVRDLRRHLLFEGLRAELFMALRQSMASEQSARLQTITGASDRLQTMVDETNRAYHQARQERITEELIELTAPRTELTD